MADALGLPLYDFAFGGAKTGFGNISPLLDGAAAAAGLSGTGVLAQIADFGTAQLGVADSAALYYISAGPNDFFEAPAVATIGTVVTNLTTAVTELYAMGARQFVLPSIADLGLTYASWQAEQVTPGAMAQASLLSAAANGALDAAYANLAAAMPDEMFYRIDTAAMQQAVLAQYTAIGGVTYTSSCLADGAVADCTGYMFFDDVHPTTDVHRIFGLATAEAVLVPEPSQWGLAAVALLAAGAATRRRARKPAASAA
jgi:MYXO-CTERM domain-containing protein